jgi:uncharacterized protein YaaQ
MSKLLIAFVHAEDATPVAEALREDGHRFTHLPSIGGFLGSDNSTIVLGVEDVDEARVVAIFQTVCRRREVDVPLVLLERLAEWQGRTVQHGGATILVADLARVIRL